MFYVSLFFLGAFIVAAIAGLRLRSSAAARPWITVAVLGASLAPVAAVLHNVVSAALGIEEALFFVLALVMAPAAFGVGALGAALGLWRAREEPMLRWSLTLAGASTALLASLALVALGVTLALRYEPEWLGSLWQAGQPVAAFVLGGGVLAAIVAVLERQDRRYLSAS